MLEPEYVDIKVLNHMGEEPKRYMKIPYTIMISRGPDGFLFEMGEHSKVADSQQKTLIT